MQPRSRARRSLAGGAPLEQTLAELTEAAARGTGADVAVLWLPDGDGVAARSVWSGSAGLAAEVEGLRVGSLEGAAALVRARLDENAEVLTVPFGAAEGDGALELARRAAPFDPDDTRLATIAAELGGLAARLAETSPPPATARERSTSPRCALAAAAGDDGAPLVARVAAVAAGGDAALVWRLRTTGSTSSEPTGRSLWTRCPRRRRRRRRGCRCRAHGRRDVCARDDAAARPAGARCAPGASPAGRLPDERGREQLAGFAVRAAHALRSSERAARPGSSLSGAALCSPSSARRSRSFRSRTRSRRRSSASRTSSASTAAVYLTDEDGLAVAASRGIEGPHLRRGGRAAGGRAAVAAGRRDRRGRRHGRRRRARAGSCPPRGVRHQLRARARPCRRRRADRRPRRLPSPAPAAERERVGAADRVSLPATGCRPERAAARARDDALRRPEAGARVRAGEVRAVARAARDLAHVRPEPLARDDA